MVSSISSPFRRLRQADHIAKGKARPQHPAGTPCPTFEKCLGSLTSHSVYEHWRVVRRGLRFIVLIREGLKTWKSNHLRMWLQWQHFLLSYLKTGVQGWRSGESTRLPPMWPGFDSQTWRHMWVEFVGSLLCIERFFSGYSGFPSPQKPKFDLSCVNLLISIYSVPD